MGRMAHRFAGLGFSPSPSILIGLCSRSWPRSGHHSWSCGRASCRRHGALEVEALHSTVDVQEAGWHELGGGVSGGRREHARLCTGGHGRCHGWSSKHGLPLLGEVIASSCRSIQDFIQQRHVILVWLAGHEVITQQVMCWGCSWREFKRKWLGLGLICNITYYRRETLMEFWWLSPQQRSAILMEGRVKFWGSPLCKVKNDDDWMINDSIACANTIVSGESERWLKAVVSSYWKNRHLEVYAAWTAPAMNPRGRFNKC